MIGSSSQRPSRTLSGILSLACLGLVFTVSTGHAQTETKTKAKVADLKVKAKTAEKEAGKKTEPLDLNKATAEEMVEALPGVGEATAKKIVAGRPYKSVDDLSKAGVPSRTLEGIRAMVVVKPLPDGEAKPEEKEKAKPKAKMTKGEAAKGEAKDPLSDKAKVNLNTGKLDELLTLPGVGEVTAKAIVAGRPYKSISDLEKVKGLGRAKIEAMRPLVIVAEIAPEAPEAKPEATPKKEAVSKKVAAKSETPAPAEPLKKAMEKKATEKVAAKPETSTPAEPAKKAMEKAATEKAAAKPSIGGLKPGEVVNINTATKEELDRLPGIGPVKAQAILDTRPFKTKEDIMKVKGIKEGEFGKIKDLITVE